jgi:hypothetical protein
MTRMTVTVRGGLCTFMIISRGVFLSIRNISDISCRENQNTHFVLDSLFLSENVAVYDKMRKYTKNTKPLCSNVI